MKATRQLLDSLDLLRAQGRLVERDATGQTLGDVDEKQFQQAVEDLAARNAWKFYHTRDSRKSVAGFPDLVMLRGACLIIAELKVGDNRPDAAQSSWLEAWRMIPGATVFVWYPSDWPEIERVLTGI